MKPVILNVAVPGPFRTGLAYQSPTDVPVVGARVKVPLGRREVIGVVLATHIEANCPIDKLKAVTEVIDTAMLFSDALWKLITWMVEYYHAPSGDLFHVAMPKHLCQGKVLKAIPKYQPIPPEQVAPALPLNEEQQLAYQQCLDKLKAFQVFLLYGVTGSGKTELYLQVMSEVLAQGKQILFLVPEIGLTPQTLTRIQQRFGVPVYTLHSDVTESQKVHVWHQARQLEPCIVLGTRSALFVPLEKLGLIVVDEEHDQSYKQQSGIRYSARDMAVRRAQLENIPVILGSATPALESWHNAQSGRYQLLTLTQRAEQAQLPAMHILSMHQQQVVSGLAPDMIQHMDKHLKSGGQVLIFLNRRGFSPILFCESCGWFAECQRCDAKMTFHISPPYLSCHRCGKQQSVPKQCPTCNTSKPLQQIGTGTEKLEHALEQRFPDYTILRLDRDSTQRKGVLDQKLEAIHKGDVDIVIGTQMIAKGHHFSGVTLVAVVDVDSALFSQDFRALEHMGQLITQVAGRAGRAEKPGEVILQTYFPQHWTLQLLLREGYSAFAIQLCEEREAAEWPPFTHLAVLMAEAKKGDAALTFLQSIRQQLDQQNLSNVAIYGPVPALLQKKAGFFRYQLLIQAPNKIGVQRILSYLDQSLYQMKSSAVRWQIDVDPILV